MWPLILRHVTCSMTAIRMVPHKLKLLSVQNLHRENLRKVFCNIRAIRGKGIRVWDSEQKVHGLDLEFRFRDILVAGKSRKVF